MVTTSHDRVLAQAGTIDRPYPILSKAETESISILTLQDIFGTCIYHYAWYLIRHKMTHSATDCVKSELFCASKIQ